MTTRRQKNLQKLNKKQEKINTKKNLKNKKNYNWKQK